MLNQPKHSRAMDTLIENGRCYNPKALYLSVRVHSKNLMDMYHLKREFGGNSYIHNPWNAPRKTYYVWALGNKKDLLKLHEKVSQLDEVPDNLKFIITYFETMPSTAVPTT